MNKLIKSNIAETIRILLGRKQPEPVFPGWIPKLVLLLKLSYTLQTQIKNTCIGCLDEKLKEMLDRVLDSLYTCNDILLKLLGEITNRKIHLHLTVKNDTLWRLSKKYTVDLAELCELNSIHNIFVLEEGSVIVVPVFFPSTDI